ncbi:SET domain-containing protein SmydA-8-like [Anthonomus grandis grandis]|uniref:SET domain-containing protein SmydA-8-like n=1 Tax=Anthonomus grandis grandis TaxID=2921223 RepID=UPI0021665D75|nr:SET domain-containing protein SmydA-8-like [Anthonomus grandis grandis]XP_050308457.1 SET domain-containing protein SmydA-8-like [Anthonomus grandis grandis]XP_050308458.1 SET domain-containing protein SmydA-8-like [Anthonomus grandis grandis]
MSGPEGQCEICQKPSNQKCSQCKLVYYCSAEHQKENWKDHKEACLPFEVQSNKELGRYLIAKRDLEPGDLIFIDSPLVFGPRPYKIQEGPFPCVGCCKLLEDKIVLCPECGWPACDVGCPGLKLAQQHGLECQVLKLMPAKQNQSPHEYFRYDTLIILRALFLQKTNQKKWTALINLEDHLENRGPNSDVFKSVQEKVNYIQQKYIAPLKMYEQQTGQSILPQVSADLIHKIYGALDVNATEITEPVDLFVLYPTASLLEHNCLPNTCQIIDNDDYKITFRAALTIKKGHHISTTYTNILWGTQERRTHLKENKYFSCFCDRCSDPTEFSTYFSALVCLGTEDQPCKGIQLPTEPTLPDPDWVCNKCNIKLPNKDVVNFVSHLSKEVDKELEKKPKLEDLEEFLNKLVIFLHPSHYLVYSVKHSLVQQYKIDGEVQMSDTFLEEKLKLCQDLINVTKKIDPGCSRLALYLAVLLNEKFMSKFTFLKRNFDAEKKDLNRDVIKEILEVIKENKAVLRYETQCETGRKLFQIACFNEDIFRNWMKSYSVEAE